MFEVSRQDRMGGLGMRLLSYIPQCPAVHRDVDLILPVPLWGAHELISNLAAFVPGQRQLLPGSSALSLPLQSSQHSRHLSLDTLSIQAIHGGTPASYTLVTPHTPTLHSVKLQSPPHPHGPPFPEQAELKSLVLSLCPCWSTSPPALAATAQPQFL